MTISGRNPLRASVPTLVIAMIALMGELIEILIAEPDLVLKRKMDMHKEMLKRKQKLALDYRAGIKSLIGQPDLLKTLPDDTRKTLRALSQKLADAAERNARTLRAAVMATQRLIQNIVTIVKDEVLPKGAYKNPRAAHLQLGTYSPTCVPVSVRRSV